MTRKIPFVTFDGGSARSLRGPFQRISASYNFAMPMLMNGSAHTHPMGQTSQLASSGSQRSIPLLYRLKEPQLSSQMSPPSL